MTFLRRCRNNIYNYIFRQLRSIVKFNTALIFLYGKCDGKMKISEKDLPCFITMHSENWTQTVTFKYAVRFLSMLKNFRNMKLVHTIMISRYIYICRDRPVPRTRLVFRSPDLDLRGENFSPGRSQYPTYIYICTYNSTDGYSQRWMWVSILHPWATHTHRENPAPTQWVPIPMGTVPTVYFCYPPTPNMHTDAKRPNKPITTIKLQLATSKPIFSISIKYQSQI